MVDETQVQEAKEEQIKDMSLDNLLAWDGVISINEKIEFPEAGSRPALTVTVRAMSAREMRECDEVATEVGMNKMGMKMRDLDYPRFRKAAIYKATNSPDLSSPELQQKFNKGNHYIDIVDKIFLPGEQERLMEKINVLSGFPSSNQLQIEEKRKDEVDLS